MSYLICLTLYYEKDALSHFVLASLTGDNAITFLFSHPQFWQLHTELITKGLKKSMNNIYIYIIYNCESANESELNKKR